mgnify:CR=1 FL=1
MGFTRQREQSRFIIKSKQNIFVRIITILATSIMWIYSFIVVYLFVSALFNYNDKYISIVKIALKVDNGDIRGFLKITMIFLIIEFIILFLWRIYNEKYCEKLNSKKGTLPSTDKDILSLHLMKEKDYFLLKNSKVMEFKKNPIKEIDEGDVLYEEDSTN